MFIAIPNVVSCYLLTWAVILRWTCCQGATTERPSVRMIIGGRDSRSSSWPWQAGLLVSREGFVCGGTLIEYDTVLTAAHCVRGLTPDRITVVLGDYNRDIPEGTEQYIEVMHTSLHPLYKDDFLGGYDIALLHLKTNATDAPGVRPIPALARLKQRLSHNDCYITGWGVTQEEEEEEEKKDKEVTSPCNQLKQVPNEVGDYGKLATRLQEANINIISNSKCNSKKFWDGIVKTTSLCAFHKNSAACEGDSGGPLVCKRKGSFVLLGTTSWGAVSCLEYPTVFTKVAIFRRWIRNQIQEKRKLGNLSVMNKELCDRVTENQKHSK
ncbi:chymotrypsin-like elastase family member 1 [Ylistrum balloti]|uniref:chymotrypsin-like elastase family member 1 n=1 Tax=Ylistrum balloti TaxID=509963 RepID=UPI002905E160|nr:chymotrypsin-like elastase family member 1 [Ylistrum balloti]